MSIKIVRMSVNRPKGRFMTGDAKRKLSLTNRGKHHSPATEFKTGHIPYNKGFSKYKISSEELREMLFSGMLHKEIAEKIGCPYGEVSQLMRHLNIRPPEHFIRYHLPNVLTSKEENLIIGTMFGDGYMRKGECLHASVSVGQSDRHYTHYKYSILKRWCVSSPRRRLNGRCLKGEYYLFYFNTHAHPVFDFYFKEFYPEGKKVLSEKLLMKLDAFGFCIWFQDDGTFCKVLLKRKDGSSYYHYGGQLRTDSFSFEENCKISDFLLSRFGVESKVRRDSKNGLFYIGFVRKDCEKISRIMKENLVGLRTVKVL